MIHPAGRVRGFPQSRGLIRFGSVRFGSVRFGSVRFGSVRFGSVRFGSVRFGDDSVWLPRWKQGDGAAGDASDEKNGGSASPPPPAAPRRRAQQISSYSWEDYGEEVRLTFRQPGWNWAEVEQEEVEVQWGPRRFRMTIDSRWVLHDNVMAFFGGRGGACSTVGMWRRRRRSSGAWGPHRFQMVIDSRC